MLHLIDPYDRTKNNCEAKELLWYDQAILAFEKDLTKVNVYTIMLPSKKQTSKQQRKLWTTDMSLQHPEFIDVVQTHIQEQGHVPEKVEASKNIMMWHTMLRSIKSMPLPHTKDVTF